MSVYGMLGSIMPEATYKCDLCGELFNSPKDAQDHNQKAHAESVLIMGTGTPSEDREIGRAHV